MGLSALYNEVVLKSGTSNFVVQGTQGELKIFFFFCALKIIEKSKVANLTKLFLCESTGLFHMAVMFVVHAVAGRCH